MKVTLKLAGGFVHTVGFSQKELDVEPGTTVADILATIAIDRGRPMIIERTRRRGGRGSASGRQDPGLPDLLRRLSAHHRVARAPSSGARRLAGPNAAAPVGSGRLVRAASRAGGSR
jgi:sulfur carrier protein ThiS